jgi:hypothetical protein
MGSTNFGNVVIGKYTPAEAYRKLCDDALYYNGHDSYNGTISTTRGFTNLTERAPRYGTKAFHKWEDDVLNHEKFSVEKWGSAGFVEISPNTSTFKQMKERYGLKGRKGVRAYYFFGWAAE